MIGLARLLGFGVVAATLSASTLTGIIPLRTADRQTNVPGATYVPALKGASRSLPSLPLNSYEKLDAQDTAVLLRANALLTSRCMTKRGFQYPAALEDTGPVSAPTVSLNDVYGITNLSQAKKYGYALPATLSSGSKSIPTMSQFIKKYGLAFFVALFGYNPSDASKHFPEGCANAGQSVIINPAFGKANRDLVSQLAGDAEARTEQDPSIVRLLARWSSCMQKQGFSYGTPMAAEQKAWPQKPSSTEIATAVADVECKLQLSIPYRWRMVEAQFQSELIHTNYGQLQTVQQDFEMMIRLAYRVLGERYRN